MATVKEVQERSKYYGLSSGTATQKLGEFRKIYGLTGLSPAESLKKYNELQRQQREAKEKAEEEARLLAEQQEKEKQIKIEQERIAAQKIQTQIKQSQIQPEKETLMEGLARKGAFTESSLIGVGLPFQPPSVKKATSKVSSFVFGAGALVGEKVTETLKKKEFGKSAVRQTKGLQSIFFPEFTKKETVAKQETVGFGAKVLAESELIPTTKEGVALTTAILPIFPKLPPVAIVGGSLVAGYTGTKTALDPTLTPAKRTAGAIIGAAGTFGAISEGLPFARGQLAKLSGGYKAVEKQAEGFEAVAGTRATITRLKGYTGKGDILLRTEADKLPFGIPKDTIIGLIKRGAPAKVGETAEVLLPKTSALVRGGFGVREAEKKAFLKAGQTVATSQQSLFKAGRNILLDREFFVTPEEQFINIAQTRVSRLGLKSGFFNVQERAGIGFGLPKTAQIGIEKGAAITKSGLGTAYKIGAGTELEATKGAGTLISGVTKVGSTAIKGQYVGLYEFKTSASPFGKAVQTVGSSTKGLVKTSGEALFSSIAGFKYFSRPTKVTSTYTPPTKLKPPTLTIPITPPTTPTKPKSPPTSSGGTPPRTPPTSIPSIPPSPITPPTKPPSRTTAPFGFAAPPRDRSFPVFLRRTEGRARLGVLSIKRTPAKPPRRSASLLAIGRGIKAVRPFKLERSSLVVRPILTSPIKKKKGKKSKKKRR